MQHLFYFIIKLEARLQSYWIHFTLLFGNVHSSGYNSAESKPIWMNSEAL